MLILNFSISDLSVIYHSNTKYTLTYTLTDIQGNLCSKRNPDISTIKQFIQTKCEKKNRSKEQQIGHWCIKSIYKGFAIAIDCTLNVVPFGFCFVEVIHLFRIMFWLTRKSEKNLACSGLQRLAAACNFFFGI